MVARSKRPARGEIWWVNLDPIVGAEQAGTRPALILSADDFNQFQDRLVIVVPMTRTIRPYTFHIQVSPEETGLKHPSAIMCDQIRTISTSRLLDPAPVGRVSAAVLRQVEDLLAVLLDLPSSQSSS